MQIPETPKDVEQLDLMRRLKDYAEDRAAWNSAVGEQARRACEALYVCISQLIKSVLAPLLDRTTSREMETFTMHDRTHGLKVAHLMWHILEPARRERLTPAEIGMLVIAAHLHDVGMALSREKREARLSPTSDLWDRLAVNASTKAAVERLRQQIANPELHETLKKRAKSQLDQAEQALLSQDTRERHATRERYEEILEEIATYHRHDPSKIPSVDSCLSFDGDSFRKKLVDVCVSHNEEAETLVRRDAENPERPRFPRDFPVGCCTADLHMVAAALRLADILDFDRERTPAALFYYLVPGALSPQDSPSALEWGKHLAISSWDLGDDEIVFRGRCSDHIVHHTIVQFCASIAKEIEATRATFGNTQGQLVWPFRLPGSVKADIHEEGYYYVPYRFELDDQRIYDLLMGGAIYDNPLVAVRELIQNSVDACRLRDAMSQLSEGPTRDIGERLVVCYEEPTDEHAGPTLTVTDTGTGMDRFVLERYFLKVGESYYRSAEFNQHRMELRGADLDFAPVSEFGIGFLSCFLLADRVEVETAMWEQVRGDTRKRKLRIDGPTRLIRWSEEQNEGWQRFKGTRITLHLARGGGISKMNPPTWQEIRTYLHDVCQELPYRLRLEHRASGRLTRDYIDAKPFAADVSPNLEQFTLRIPIKDLDMGFEGEIAFTNREPERERLRGGFLDGASAALELRVGNFDEERLYLPHHTSTLLRGGFRIGDVPGAPPSNGNARLRLTWKSRGNRQFLLTNLARNAPSEAEALAERVTNRWLSYALQHVDELPEGLVLDMYAGTPVWTSPWLQAFDAFTVYRFAAQGWKVWLRDQAIDCDKLREWEGGCGESLPLPLMSAAPHYAAWAQLLFLVLPLVADLQLGNDNDNPDGPVHWWHVKMPTGNWHSILQGRRDYVAAPVKWGPFVEFIGRLNTTLAYYDGLRVWLNVGYRDRFKSICKSEYPDLLRVLSFVFEGGRGLGAPVLTPKYASLLRRVVDVAGDLCIVTDHWGSWRLDSVKLTHL